jgi:sulfur carrier protein ThiS
MTASRSDTGRITVRMTLFADLRRYLPKGVEGAQRVALPAHATVADLLAAAGVPPQDEITVGLNGELAALDTPLNDGDDVVFFSPMEGG